MFTSPGYESPWVTDNTPIFRRRVRHFIEQDLAPHQTPWAKQGHSDVIAGTKEGQTGLLLTDIHEVYSGGGGTFAHEAIVIEGLSKAGTSFGAGVQISVANNILEYGNVHLDPVSAAMAKYWLSDCQCRIIDECLLIHGGFGYMEEFPIARMWRDSRVQRIYGGTNEVMKELVGRSL